MEINNIIRNTQVFYIFITVPVNTTVFNINSQNEADLRIDLNNTDDIIDILCEKTAVSLLQQNKVTKYPTVHMCIEDNILFLNTNKLHTDINVGRSLRCTIEFSIRCNIPPSDDVAVDRVKAVSLVAYE